MLVCVKIWNDNEMPLAGQTVWIESQDLPGPPPDPTQPWTAYKKDMRVMLGDPYTGTLLYLQGVWCILPGVICIDRVR
jgi:hypothetical protein